MRKLESVVTGHNEIEVWEDSEGRIDFEVAGATHATWHPQRLLTGHAWDAITAAVLLHPAPCRRLLMLGLGGGTALRQLRLFLPDLQITAVEIDPEMVRLARRYMELDALGVEVVLADAFDYLEKPPRRFDVVMDDLYRGGPGDVERPRPVDRPLLELLCGALEPGGTLTMNFVTGRGHHRRHLEARAAFLDFFSSVRAVRPPKSHNEVLAGNSGPQALKGSGALRSLRSVILDPRDLTDWKELRNLKLR